MELENEFVTQQTNLTTGKTASLHEDCCEIEGHIRDPKNLCFRSLPTTSHYKNTIQPFAVCIPARDSITNSSSYCISSPASPLNEAMSPSMNAKSLCSGIKSKDENHSFYCMQPASESLLQMKRKEYNLEVAEIQRLPIDFLFVGNPAQVYDDVIISNYLPR